MANEKLENLKAMKTDHMLDEKDLAQVTGGTVQEMVDDAKFLNVLLKGRPEQPGRYGAYTCENDKKAEAALQEAWFSVGIRADMYRMSNTYAYEASGYRITRAQAWAHAEKVIGRHLERKDWDW